MVTQQIDQAKAEAFGGQMVGILNGAILALMTSIGHRTGLFDKMAALAPSTSQQIAEDLRMNPSTVRSTIRHARCNLKRNLGLEEEG